MLVALNISKEDPSKKITSEKEDIDWKDAVDKPSTVPAEALGVTRALTSRPAAVATKPAAVASKPAVVASKSAAVATKPPAVAKQLRADTRQLAKQVQCSAVARRPSSVAKQSLPLVVAKQSSYGIKECSALDNAMVSSSVFSVSSDGDKE